MSRRKAPPSLASVRFLDEPLRLEKMREALQEKVSSARNRLHDMAARVEADPLIATRRGVYPEAEAGDPLRQMVYEQRGVTGLHDIYIREEGHVSHRAYGAGKTADTPLNYLFKRGTEKNRITSTQYAAGLRYREDATALSRVGSNTASTIDHIMMAPTLTAEDRWAKLHEIGLNTYMAGGCDARAVRDPSDGILATVYRLKRVEDRLDTWELNLLRELVVAERPIGLIANGWGLAPEAVSVLARMALWKLARVMENCDREFQAWLLIERQVSGEARE